MVERWHTGSPMAGKRANVVHGDDSFMEYGMCRRTRRVIVETADGPVESEAPIVDPVCFFSEDGRSLLDKMRTVEARVACGLCPVKTECLEWAIAAREEHGIWGGMDRDQRAKIARRRRSRVVV